MTDIRNTSTNYVHPTDPNLLNLHKAMEFNDAGQPVVRVHAEGIVFSGTVVVTSVEVTGTVAVSNFPTTSTVYQGTDPWVITGTVAVSNFPTTSTVYQGTNPWTVTGTVAVSNFPTTSTVYQGTDPWVVSGNVTASITGTTTVTFPTGGNDAFGRLRTSEPYTLFDTRARYYDHQQFSSSTSTGGTVTYVDNESAFHLTVTGSSGSEVVRETKRVFPYQPGKSLLILNTFAMANTSTNVRQRVGFFNSKDGVFFEEKGENQYFVIRSLSTGTLSEEKVPRNLWNGPDAGIYIQTNATQILWSDVEWLGVGSVRCGFIIDGQYKLMHTFHHANRTQTGVPLFTTTYMTTACLPIRYEITNTAETGGSRTMKQICSTVISEGGYNAYSTTESAGTGITVFRLVSASTYYPVVSIRLKSTRLDSIVVPRQVDILSPTVNYYRWVLLLNPTLTGATWSSTSTSGSVEIDTAASANAVTGGIEVASGYVSSRELTTLGADFFAFQLGRTLAGVSDVITLALAATSNNADVLAQIGWQEIT